MEELGNLIQVVTDGRILGNQFLKFGKFGSDIVVDFYVFVQRTLPDINSNSLSIIRFSALCRLRAEYDSPHGDEKREEVSILSLLYL